MNENLKRIQAEAEGAIVQALGTEPLSWTIDAYGNEYGWLRLHTPEDMAKLAPVLVRFGARLMTITAYRVDKFARLEGREIAYHFDIDGLAVTVTLTLAEKEPGIPSITRWFANADWHEREFSELYGITISDHPNPRRLFLDNELDAGVLDRLVPLSTLMNGASTNTLWEKVFAGKQMPDWAKKGNN